ELEIGKFLTKNPEIRKDLFIASKASGAKTIADIDNRLKTSFERMNTTYIDLYYGVHGLSEPEQLTEELKQWVKEAKKQKLIRFFGFTNHKNMGLNLAAAAKHDWIDAVMASYNFRLMQDEEIQAGIEACHNAGIAVIAMKTLGRRTDHNIETEKDKKLVGPFLQQGLTEDQAKIKVVLQDKRITTACVGMNNIAHLAINAAAAIDKTKLSKADIEALSEYARATCTGYCAGCTYICDAAAPETPYISEIMRYLMYYNSYGQHQYARELFAVIPAHIRAKLLTTDYSTAETRCPQHLPIAKLVAEAVKKLA
ncbi:MAG: aldo/keto reductase, partial [Sedimentisphaerales bacterium]|nr:aldo/keto reductase [Sedimentisphaerales bacterium]